MLEVKEISVVRGGRKLVDGVSLVGRPGDFIVILGPNGAGKSTFLKAVTGEYPLSGGSVKFGNRVASDWSGEEIAKVRAVLPQELRLNFPFRVLEVVLLGRMPHSRNGETADDYRIAMEALESVGMSAMATRNYLTLSGGEKQRVQLARILAQLRGEDDGRCRYLFLDEPVSALDPAHQHLVLRLAAEEAKAGAVVVSVLHDVNLAAHYASHWLVLKEGKKVISGEVGEVLSVPLIEETFGVRAEILRDRSGGGMVVATSGLPPTGAFAVSSQR